MRRLKIASIVLTALYFASISRASCVMYGVCERGDKTKYCQSSQVAKPLNQTAIKILQDKCPEYVSDDGKSAVTCCDDEQVKVFTSALDTAAVLLERCPACWRNFRRLFCTMTCDPNQNEFVRIAEIVQPKTVTHVQYYLTEKFAQTMYDSLKDVSAFGGKAITTICGANCNMTNLFNALGDDKDQAPFRIDFKWDEAPKGVTPMHKPSLACNESVPPCSCSDCRASCVIPPTPNTPKGNYLILGIDAYWFIMGLVFVAFFVGFVVVHIVLATRSCRPQEEEFVPLVTSDDLSQTIGFQAKISAKLDSALSVCFGKIAYGIASYPVVTLCVASALIICLGAGLTRFQVTTDPVDLWSDPSSRARQERDYFNTNFGPFYRTEQLIIRPKNMSNVSLEVPDPNQPETLEFGPAWTKEFLSAVLDIQLDLMKVQANSSEPDKIITLRDVCFKPLYPDSDACAITSPLEYFQANRTLFEFEERDEFGELIGDYLNRLLYCVDHKSAVSKVPNGGGVCLSSASLPMPSNLVFGGFPGRMLNASSAVVLTMLVNNHLDASSEQAKMALAWEQAFIDRVRQLQNDLKDNLTISFQAERSIEDELARQSNADVFTVAISYLVMFVYVSLCLGSNRSIKTCLVDLKVTLGLGGVLIVVLAVVCSVAVWSYAGVPASLIIIEVIPFLVLAVGVDNIFIIVQDFELDGDGKHGFVSEQFAPRFRHFYGEASPNQVLSGNSPATSPHRDDFDDDVSTMPIGEEAATLVQPRDRARQEIVLRVSRTLSRVGPSIFLSSLSEACAFFCGCVTSMQAIKVFSMYAGLAIVINFLMQLTVFVALLTLDARRTVARKFDICCCFGLSHRATVPVPEETFVNGSDPLQDTPVMRHEEVHGEAPRPAKRKRPWLHILMADYVAPVLLGKWVRPLILLVLVAWACFCIAVIPDGIEVGLDQRLSMPKDSYMLDYFNALSEFLRIGPPVYFVVTADHNYSTFAGQNRVCSATGCNNNSLVNKLSMEALNPTYSRLAEPPMSWLDDYFDWLKTGDDVYQCCRVLKANHTEYCNTDAPKESCMPCPVTYDQHGTGVSRPNSLSFDKFLPRFLDQNPGIHCPKAGRAGYHAGVELANNAPRTDVVTSYFMSYHTVLGEYPDFLEALRQSRRIVAEINQAWHNGTEKRQMLDQYPAIPKDGVFAYSIFYVFYEQYLTTYQQVGLQLGICLCAVMAITLIVLGLNFLAALIVLIGVALILLSMGAVMALWGIQLNALSLVNLVVSIGIAVEFCVHIVRSFTVSLARTRVDRAKDALATMGSSVLRGITLTKLGGIVVLAFSKSRLFQIFYFRMYLTMVVSGAVVGLVFIPVILSYIGPSLNAALVVQNAYHKRVGIQRQATFSSVTTEDAGQEFINPRLEAVPQRIESKSD